MKVKIDTSGLRESKSYEYVVRFMFGGAVTLLAGIIAKRFGPGIGGLFLAFPAILPATATLIQKHETEKKQLAGIEDKNRGRAAAGVDAAGAAMGSIGLIVFALIVWQLLPQKGVLVVLSAATLGWLAISMSIWEARERLWRRWRQRRISARRSRQASLECQSAPTNRRRIDE